MGASATVTHHQKGEHGLTWSREKTKKTIQFKKSPSGYSHGPFPVDPMDLRSLFIRLSDPQEARGQRGGEVVAQGLGQAMGKRDTFHLK